jgi:DNA polymerase III subunit alpha
MHSNFIHLRTHSSYSLSEGAMKVDELVKLCKKNKMPALALTDTGNLFCALEFASKCIKGGVQPIPACLTDFNAKLNKSYMATTLDKIVLIAKNKEGFKNLLHLVSSSYLNCDNDGHFVDIDYLSQHSQGLIAFTGGYDSTLYRLLKDSNKSAALKHLDKLTVIFGDRLYIELIRRGIDQDKKLEKTLIELALEKNIPLVASNDVYFSDPSMHEAHDALLCISDGRYIAEKERRRSNKENYFKTPEQMEELFRDIPEAIENTINIAKRCSYIVEDNPPMLPVFDVDEETKLRQQSKDGLELRLQNFEGDKKPYYDRLDYELGVILDMKFPGYFLIVSDFIKWSKRNGIPVGPGRGSGAGSVVAWSLQITDLDPLKFGLIFERFLNPERVSMPDFDIDFCQDRRDEVISYVQSKYGDDRVAQIITFGKLQARAVIRDVGRVMQMSYSHVDKISKMVPFNPTNPVTLSQAIEIEPLLQNERDTNPEVAKLLSMALKLEGLHRHASTHAAGIVIADRKLEEIVPLYKDQKSEMMVVQYSMKYAEMAGLVKFDFLGLKTLTMIANACKLIKQKNVDINIDKLPLDDKNTYELLSKGNSIGVFQFESSGMRDSLRKLRPDAIEDLMALGALYRPGPMDNISTFIACKHGLQKPDYIHPKLEDMLKETFGVIIYQEQVLQVAQILAGYSLGAADLLRRAMGKKIKKEMDDQRALFVQGAVNNGVKKEQASVIFDVVAKFAGYGFNRAHAASYAIISYQTAYLKANHPLEFLTASMNLDINDTDKINIFVQEASKMGIEILSPSINDSEACFKIEENAIRYGLGALKSVGVAAMEDMVEERNENEGFSDVFDFVSRCNSKVVNKRQLESLIKSGAFDKLSANRKQLFDSVDILSSLSASVNRDKDSNQISLFGSGQTDARAKPHLCQTADWENSDKLNFEYESFGFYLHNHPLEAYQDALKIKKIHDSRYLQEKLKNGFSVVSLAGVVISNKKRVSPRGRFVSAVISDCNGNYEISVFDSDLLASCSELISTTTPLFIKAEARKDEGGIRLTAQTIMPLDDYLENLSSQIVVWLKDIETVDNLRKMCQCYGEGKTRLKINVMVEGQIVEIKLNQQYAIPASKVSEIQALDGIIKLEVY